jgi:hypothetical protein
MSVSNGWVDGRAVHLQHLESYTFIVCISIQVYSCNFHATTEDNEAPTERILVCIEYEVLRTKLDLLRHNIDLQSTKVNALV